MTRSYMKVFQSFTLTGMALAFLMVVGTPGIVKSQFYDPYYDPYYNYGPYASPYGYGYGYGGYGPGGYGPGGYGPYDDYIPTDNELRAVIARDLATSPFVDGEQIRVSVDNREVTLSGRVEDRSAMVDAVEIAYDAGAYKVRNHLRKMERDERPWTDMSDRELRAEIEDELSWSPFVNEENLRVSVRNGVATLSGGVENEGEIADAVENAYEAGARRVKSRMWVDPELSEFFD